MVMHHNILELVRANVGTQIRLTVNQAKSSLSSNLSVEFLRGKLYATRTDQSILIEGHLESEIFIECVRCLDRFELPLQIRLEELYALSPSSGTAEPMQVVAPDGVIDLTLPLREQILLTQPINPVCRADCNGLCDKCGENLNEGTCDCKDETIDPRMESLKSLL